MSPGNRVVLAALGGVNSKPCVSLPCRSYHSLLAKASELLDVRVFNKINQTMYLCTEVVDPQLVCFVFSNVVSRI